MNKNYLKSIVWSLVAATTLSSCVDKDEWGTPNITCTNKFDAANTTLADVKAMAPSSGYKLIETDVIFDGYVVSSDENGNFYKTISFQDKPENPTAALQIEVDKASNYADFPVGSHIRINAKGLRVGTDRGVVKLGSVDPTYAIGRIPGALLSRYISGVCSGSGIEIAKIVPLQLPSLKAAQDAKYINMLVTVPNVQFSKSENGKTYVDFVAGVGADTDRKIEDATGGSSILRSSGFFSGGATALPTGKGDLTFVVSRYNSSWQMLIRSLADVNLTGERFVTGILGGTALTYTTPLTETFDAFPVGTSASNLVAPQYINYAEAGDRYWQITKFGNNNYIQMSANKTTVPVHTYFIVPVTFNGNNKISFSTKDGYNNGNVLKVYYSTSYVPGASVDNTKLTDITSKFTIASGTATGYAANYTDSGVYNLTGVSGKGYIFFEYTGSSTLTTTMQIDNISVQ